jgi:hypothetical protein
MQISGTVITKWSLLNFYPDTLHSSNIRSLFWDPYNFTSKPCFGDYDYEVSNTIPKPTTKLNSLARMQFINNVYLVAKLAVLKGTTE